MIAFMSGPALQGIVVASAGRGAAYAVHFVFGLIALAGLALLRPRPLAGCGESDWVGRGASDGRRA